MGRMLLQLNSPAANAAMSSDLAIANTANSQAEPAKNAAPSTTREITSVNDNENVAKAVCGYASDSNRCSVVSVKKTVSTAQFCQDEGEIIAELQSEIDDAVQSATDDALEAIHITSVLQSNRDNICTPELGRRMLAVDKHDLVFTLVLEVRAMVKQFSINMTTLGDNQITAITGLTNDSFWRLCNGLVTNDCVKKIAKEYNATRDILVDFSLHISDPANNPVNISSIKNILRETYVNSSYVVIPPLIRMADSNQTQFQARISVPFLQEYSDVHLTAAKHGLVRAGFQPEDNLQTKIVLKMAFNSVNATVVNNVRTVVAASYAINIQKVDITVLPETMAGETTLLVNIYTLVKPFDVGFVVTITLIFPLTSAAFNAQQSAYVASVATVADVSFNKVAVGTVSDVTTTQRRLLTPMLSVVFEVTVSSLAESQRIAGAITLDALNREFLRSGLAVSTLSVPAVISLAPQLAARQLAKSRELALQETLTDMKLTSPENQLIYIDITIDGEKHPKNNDAVVLLYLLCIFLIILMILLLLWARHYFAVKSDSTQIASYDAMPQDTKVDITQGNGVYQNPIFSKMPQSAYDAYPHHNVFHHHG